MPIGLFISIVNYQFKGILVKNDTNISIKFPRKLRLGIIQKLEYKYYFYSNIFIDTTIIIFKK